MNATKPTREQIADYLDAVRAIGDAVMRSGSVPSGTMYAVLMGKMSLETYNGMIGVLVRAGLVRQDASYMLHWIGPRE